MVSNYKDQDSWEMFDFEIGAGFNEHTIEHLLLPLLPVKSRGIKRNGSIRY